MASDPYGEFSDKLGLKFETHEGNGPRNTHANHFPHSATIHFAPPGRLPMGPRTRRYVLLLDDGIIKYVAVDVAGLQDTSAEAVLARL